MPEQGEPVRRRGVLTVIAQGTARTLFDYVRIIVREKDLFFGVAFILLGFLNFNSDKYCDGNAADYLSCTRPATFYYFDTIDIALIILGAFCILVWFMKERYRARVN